MTPALAHAVAVPSTTTPARLPSYAGFSALVVGAHRLPREAMVGRLRAMGARQVVQAASIAQARDQTRFGVPRDVGLLDATLPDGSGLDLLSELRAAGWRRLVLISAADDPAVARAAFLAGAQGYLLATASPATVADGVRRVLGGGTFADRKLLLRLAGGPTEAHAAAGLPALSDREIDVLQLVANGRSNKQVGQLLTLSALTVKSHLARIGRKLGTGDRAEMVAIAMRAGVIR